MGEIVIKNIAPGFFWVEIEKVGLKLLCGCPPDSVKLLKQAGILSYDRNTSQGPNAILLSDQTFNESGFANLSEFPVMHMLYVQGMLFNDSNRLIAKPKLIGTPEMVNSQIDYLSRGNYGLLNEHEMQLIGLDENTIRKFMAIKMYFAKGKIYSHSEMFDPVFILNEAVEIWKDVFLQRVSFNQFKLKHDGDEVLININFDKKSVRRNSIHFEFNKSTALKLSAFSVVHLGEGNGWYPNNPCMSSLIFNEGLLFVVDPGPGFGGLLSTVGLTVNDLEGAFVTHTHDDHCAGLHELFLSSKKIGLYTSKAIRVSLEKKFSSLAQEKEDVKFLSSLMDIHDLELDEWNNVAGMDVKPFISPHPVETNAFHFRKSHRGKEYHYSHLADTSSFEELDRLTTSQEGNYFLSKEEVQDIKDQYSFSANVKKVDVGGGFIHGEMNDYTQDKSNKIIFSHTEYPSRKIKGEWYKQPSFGMQDFIIDPDNDEHQKHGEMLVRNVLAGNRELFSDDSLKGILSNIRFERITQEHSLVLSQEEMLIPVLGAVKTKDQNDIIFRRGSIINYAAKNKESLIIKSITSMALVALVSGRYEAKITQPTSLPTDKYMSLILHSGIMSGINDLSILNQITKNSEVHELPTGSNIELNEGGDVYLILSGTVSVIHDHDSVLALSGGEFLGGIIDHGGSGYPISYAVKESSRVLIISGSAIKHIPLVKFKAYENYAHHRDQSLTRKAI